MEKNKRTEKKKSHRRQTRDSEPLTVAERYNFVLVFIVRVSHITSTLFRNVASRPIDITTCVCIIMFSPLQKVHRVVRTFCNNALQRAAHSKGYLKGIFSEGTRDFAGYDLVTTAPGRRAAHCVLSQ